VKGIKSMMSGLKPGNLDEKLLSKTRLDKSLRGKGRCGIMLTSS
jgi:hypothetical protein